MLLVIHFVFCENACDYRLAEERAKGLGARLNTMQDEHSALRGQVRAVSIQ